MLRLTEYLPSTFRWMSPNSTHTALKGTVSKTHKFLPTAPIWLVCELQPVQAHAFKVLECISVDSDNNNHKLMMVIILNKKK